MNREEYYTVRRWTQVPYDVKFGARALPLWNDQIESVSIGDEIELKKAYVKAFQGVLQIVPSRRKGELTIIKPSKQVIQSR